MRLILIENQISVCYHPLNHSNSKRLFMFYRSGIFGGCTTYALQWLILKTRNRVNPNTIEP